MKNNVMDDLGSVGVTKVVLRLVREVRADVGWSVLHATSVASDIVTPCTHTTPRSLLLIHKDANRETYESFLPLRRMHPHAAHFGHWNV